MFLNTGSSCGDKSRISYDNLHALWCPAYLQSCFYPLYEVRLAWSCRTSLLHNARAVSFNLFWLLLFHRWYGFRSVPVINIELCKILAKPRRLPFYRKYFWINFLALKLLYLDPNLSDISSRFCKRQYASNGSDNGLAPSRRQAIIWINDVIFHWRIHGSHGLDHSIYEFYILLCVCIRYLWGEARYNTMLYPKL